MKKEKIRIRTYIEGLEVFLVSEIDTADLFIDEVQLAELLKNQVQHQSSAFLSKIFHLGIDNFES